MRTLCVWLLLTATAWAETTTVRAPAAVQQIGDIRWLKADVKRPKVALVLSGGAARGFAQLGVLRAWEESGAPLDFIVGTSIGGTLGGLYAAGYSADSLTRIVRSTDWGELLSNTPSRRSLFLSHRHQHEKAIIELQFDGFKPRLPRGVSSGQKLSVLLADLTRSVDYRINGDFDRLRIPLRVVATDLVSGERVVIGSGSLRDALRSTVAIPLAFTPWETEGRLLADGGLLDPIPVDVARELGADIVVAVNTTLPLLPREDLTDPLTLANQATSVMVLKQQQAQLRNADLVITPQLDGISNSDFQKVDTLIARGYAAAHADLADLASRLGLPDAPHANGRRWRIVASEGNPDFDVEPSAWITENDLQRMLAQAVANGDLQRADVKVISLSDTARLVWQLNPLPVVQRIEVTGNTLLATERLQAELSGLRGQRIRGPALEAAVAAIEGLYSGTGYPLVAAENVTLADDGTLHVTIDEAPVGSLTVSGNKRTNTNFILAQLPHLVGRPLASADLDHGISSVYASGLFESVTAGTLHSAAGPQVALRVEEQAFTRLQLGLHWHEQFHGEMFAELADINVAGRGHKIAGLAQYGERRQKYAGALSADRLFRTLFTYRLNLYHTREQWSLYVLTEKLPQSLLFHRTGGTLSFGHQIQRFGLLSAGLRVEDVDSYLEPDVDFERWYLRTIRIEAELDTYDRYPIPSDGYYQRLSLERADEFLGGNARYTKFSAEVEGVIPLGHRHATLLSLHAGTADTYLPESERFFMGGQHHFVGLRYGEMRGDHYWKGGLALRLHNGGRRYITIQYNVGNMWPTAARIDLFDVIHGIGAAYTLNSPAGPLDLGIGIATDRPLIGYVNFGLMW